ncbi:MAG: type II toxin-antitoxin system HigB family toxin [Mucilaginibacter sp.]|uniref:type II toxin-antitoxin system HigB family toxin n=1 Tax=Mucilaginibacter sp. TaxID=1882438 RepID=UPI0034E53F7F
MRLTGKQILIKVKHKNKGNTLLCAAIDELVATIEQKDWKSKTTIIKDRPDADEVHNNGFYFFDIHIHRTLILIEFDAEGEATVVWCGTHDEYNSIFKNNKATIKKWLSSKGWI